LSKQTGKGALLVAGQPSQVTARGMERIRAKAPVPVDVLYDRDLSDPVPDNYAWVLDLDPRRPGNLPGRAKAVTEGRADCPAYERRSDTSATGADAWAV